MTPPDPFTYRGPGRLLVGGEEVTAVTDVTFALGPPVPPPRGFPECMGNGPLRVSGSLTFDVPADWRWPDPAAPWPRGSYRGRALTVVCRPGCWPVARARRTSSGAPLADPRPGGVRERVERREGFALLALAMGVGERLPRFDRISVRHDGVFAGRGVLCIRVVKGDRDYSLRITAGEVRRRGVESIADEFLRHMVPEGEVLAELREWAERNGLRVSRPSFPDLRWRE